jgi:hypothetical protein
MSERLLHIPEHCQQALAAIETNPLDLTPEVLAHLRDCPPCAEARVYWLAQEEALPVLAPRGYFERLPDRVIHKLPTRRRIGLSQHPWLWLAAAALALALGVGGYVAGRVQPTAPTTQTAEVAPDPSDILSDTPFSETDDAMTQFTALSAQDAEAVLHRMDAAAQAPRP